MMIKDTIIFPEQAAKWKESGLSMVAYCKEQGLNYQTFTYHALCIKKKETVASAGNRFVQIKEPEKTRVGIVYYLPNGDYFIFAAGCTIQLIKSLIG